MNPFIERCKRCNGLKASKALCPTCVERDRLACIALRESPELTPVNQAEQAFGLQATLAREAPVPAREEAKEKAQLYRVYFRREGKERDATSWCLAHDLEQVLSLFTSFSWRPTKVMTCDRNGENPLQVWPAPALEHTPPEKTLSPTTVQNIKKAALCVKIAQTTLPNGTSTRELQDEAAKLMSMDRAQLETLHTRLCLGSGEKLPPKQEEPAKVAAPYPTLEISQPETREEPYENTYRVTLSYPHNDLEVTKPILVERAINTENARWIAVGQLQTSLFLQYPRVPNIQVLLIEVRNKRDGKWEEVWCKPTFYTAIFALGKRLLLDRWIEHPTMVTHPITSYLVPGLRMEDVVSPAEARNLAHEMAAKFQGAHVIELYSFRSEKWVRVE
jgi:hypothetical protein